MSGITINPALVTNAPGLFSVSTSGYVQGTALNDPAVRNELVQGIVAAAATTPMWGGIAITDSLVPLATIADAVGFVLAPATVETNITGFTVFDQATAMFSSPQSPVPLAPAGDGSSKPGGFINFYRLGSGARIVVACSQAVASALAGAASDVALYWDYTNQLLLSAPGGTALPVKLVGLDTKGTSKVVTYNSGTGFATWNETGYSAVIQI
jgi:hypothetical protein